MNLVELDARSWQSPDDFYGALLKGLGAPDWHGRNIAALIDSLIVGDINQVGSPLRVTVTGLNFADNAVFDELIGVFVALTRYGAVAQIMSGQASIEIAEGVSPFPLRQTGS